MTNMDYTDITFIIDKSGSMLKLTLDTIGGFNTFLKDQQSIPGKCSLSLVQFNEKVYNKYTGVDINLVAPLDETSYKTGGWTALLDALGRTIDLTGQRFAAMREEDRPGKVLFVIITDGQENESREYSADQVRAMIKKQEKDYKWNFTFMGADLSSIREAQALGIDSAHKYSHTGMGVNAVYTSLASNVRTYRGASGQAVYACDVTPADIENRKNN